MHYIILYSFKHDPSPCNILGKLRECGLEGMSQFLSNLLHEPSPCVLPSRQGTLVPSVLPDLIIKPITMHDMKLENAYTCSITSSISI